MPGLALVSDGGVAEGSVMAAAGYPPPPLCENRGTAAAALHPQPTSPCCRITAPPHAKRLQQVFFV